MIYVDFSGSQIIRKLIAGACFMVLAGGASAAVAAEKINIYSHRQQVLIQPFLDAFTAKTGIETNVVYAAKGLAQRLKAEGPASPADVILTVDIARLAEYADLDLLAPIRSKILTENIPSRLRADDNRWFGLSERARILVTSKSRVADGEIADLEDLAKPEWKGRICSRAGSHDYNRALVASMIAAHGEAATEAWAGGVVANLARKPQGNDRSQAKAIFQGLCDVAVMNSYYYGNMKFGDKADQKEWAQSIRLVFTNQSNRGNHMNISGGGVAKYAKNKAAAIAFLEFLTKEKAQQLYGEINFEYPVNPAVTVNGELASWGKFKPDALPIERLAELAPNAQMIIDRVGW
jgi:iron(III) transport system substrate-binding protein